MSKGKPFTKKQKRLYCWYGSNFLLHHLLFLILLILKVIHHFLLTHNCLKAFQFCANRKEHLNIGKGCTPGLPQIRYKVRRLLKSRPHGTAHLGLQACEVGLGDCDVELLVSAVDSEAGVLSSSLLPLTSWGWWWTPRLRWNPPSAKRRTSPCTRRQWTTPLRSTRISARGAGPTSSSWGPCWCPCGCLALLSSSSSSGPWLLSTIGRRSTNRAGQEVEKTGATNS